MLKTPCHDRSCLWLVTLPEKNKQWIVCPPNKRQAVKRAQLAKVDFCNVSLTYHSMRNMEMSQKMMCVSRQSSVILQLLQKELSQICCSKRHLCTSPTFCKFAVQAQCNWCRHTWRSSTINQLGRRNVFLWTIWWNVLFQTYSDWCKLHLLTLGWLMCPLSCCL